jgi:hypothetical protein
MAPISRGFGGRRRDDVDPSRIPPGQYYERGFPVLSALVGPLGLPWWLSLPLLVVAALVVAGLRNLARRWREGFWSSLAVLRSAQGRGGILGLVLVAVLAQIARNWLMLHAVGVQASVFDATAALIA